MRLDTTFVADNGDRPFNKTLTIVAFASTVWSRLHGIGILATKKTLRS